MVPSLLLPFLLAAPPQPPVPPPQEAVLLGACTIDQILKHREIFQSNTDKTLIPPRWAARWKALDTPCLLVVAFGSWCGDSQQQLPDLLPLMKEPNPFVDVRFLGVARDKKAEAAWWPKGIKAPVVDRVPTFWLYTVQSGGSYKLVGSVVETPPKPDQRMAESLLELLEKAR